MDILQRLLQGEKLEDIDTREPMMSKMTDEQLEAIRNLPDRPKAESMSAVENTPTPKMVTPKLDAVPSKPESNVIENEPIKLDPVKLGEASYQKDLAAAQKERDSMIKTRAIIEGLAQMAAGFAGTSSGFNTGEVKPDLSFLDKIAQNKVQDVVDNQQAKFQDPKSAESNAMREQVASMYGLKVPQNISAAQLQKQLPNLINQKTQERRLAMEEARSRENAAMREREFQMRSLSTAQGQEREKRLADEQVARDRTRKLNAARGLIKDDPRAKKALEQAMEFESVMPVLDQASSGNEAAVAALGTKLARAMGEVGVLTDTDVVRYVGGTSWGRKLKDWFTRGAKGELPPEVVTDLQENIGVIREKLGTNYGKVYDNAKGRLKTAFPDISDEEASGLLGVKNIVAEQVENKEAPYGEVVERNGKKYKWNPSVGKYQVME